LAEVLAEVLSKTVEVSGLGISGFAKVKKIAH
jgi:hypothetical protein